MKVIQTFWTGDGAGNVMGMTGGWLSPEYHWMSWALSACQAKKVFGAVHLVTDTAGKRMLVDVLKIPYDSISTALDNLPAPYPNNLWSIAKILSYGMQEEPFLHLDGDVYTWVRPSDEFLSSGLIAQNREKDLPPYRQTLEAINRHFPYVPSYCSKENYEGRAIFSANAGMLGGTDLGFIKEYCKAATDFVDRNRSALGAIEAGMLNFIFEQYFFYQLAEARSKEIRYLWAVTIEDPMYKDLVRWQDVPVTPMVHPVGSFKKMQHLCNHLARHLREAYPAIYYRIIAAMRRGSVAMQSRVYHYMPVTGPLKKDDGLSDLDVYINEMNVTDAGNGVDRSYAQSLARQWFGDDGLLAELYREDALQYRVIVQVFSEGRWKECRIGRGRCVPAGEWKVLSPSVLQLAVEEHALDTLDALLFEYCAEDRSGADVLVEMEQHFDPVEIGANYEDFAGLIRESIQRLLFAGILRITELNDRGGRSPGGWELGTFNT